MNKKRPNEIRQDFENETDALVSFFRDASNGFTSGPHEKKNMTILSELVFLNSYVAFETFLSDLFMAYINKSSMSFQNAQEAKIKKLIKSEFGDWYSNRISMGKVQHLKASEVEDLIDPKGFNLTFSSSSEIKRIAGEWVDQQFRKNIFLLTIEDFQFIDCCREIRNSIAHKSKRSISAMNDMLRAIPNPGTIEFLHRPANEVKVVGVFLKSKHRGEFRVVKCVERLKDIAIRM